jgi:hypothetical protein
MQNELMMTKKKTKRQVVSLDTSNQLGLFTQELLPETKEHTQSTPSTVKFNAPDPRNILLTGVRLDEYLQRSGE